MARCLRSAVSACASSGFRINVPPRSFRRFGNAHDDERLKAELGIEYAKLSAWRDAVTSIGATELELDELIATRRAGSSGDLYTPEEKDTLKKYASTVGCSDVDSMIQLMRGKLGATDGVRARFTILKLLEGPLGIVMRRIVYDPNITFPDGSFLDDIPSPPSIDADIGFYSNAEMDAEHARYTIEHRKFISTVGSSQNVITGSHEHAHELLMGRKMLKSPFGPISSSASFEELGSLMLVTLRQLHRNGVGRLMPRSKILLTVVQPALVSHSGCITAVVKDSDGQHVRIQVWNTSPKLAPTAEGCDAYLVGARFFLKNPFLKRGLNDSWLLLRVDQPFDLQSIDVPLRGEILVVGDGDFSYSAALARVNKKQGRAQITATSLDSMETVIEKYANAKCTLRALTGCSNVTVLHNIDASDLEPAARRKVWTDPSRRVWDSIVWNFPYPVNPVNPKMANSQEGARLLSAFFATIGTFLSQDGRIYITLATKQGGE